MLVDMKPIEEQLQELRERRSTLDIRIQKLEAIQQRRLQTRDKVRRINGVISFPFPSAA
jgi:chaperonin cofactor prefoldin